MRLYLLLLLLLAFVFLGSGCITSDREIQAAINKQKIQEIEKKKQEESKLQRDTNTVKTVVERKESYKTVEGKEITVTTKDESTHVVTGQTSSTERNSQDHIRSDEVNNRNQSEKTTTEFPLLGQIVKIVLGLLAGGGTLGGIGMTITKILGDKNAVSELIDGIQQLKMANPTLRDTINEKLASTQSPATQAKVDKYKKVQWS